jgi:signal transduction histidine kinase
VLSHHGLVEALRTQAGLLPIEVHVEVATPLRDARFPDAVEEAAYYVASEGLTNVLKHAGTGRATVKLGMGDGQLIVEVKDQGHGCDPATPPGSGLVGLRDRLGSLGGELSIDSRPGDGTTLRAALPARMVDRHA